MPTVVFNNIAVTSLLRDRATIEWDTNVPTTNNQVLYSTDLSYGLSNEDFTGQPYHHKVTIVFPSTVQPTNAINYKVSSSAQTQAGPSQITVPSPIAGATGGTYIYQGILGQETSGILVFSTNWFGNARVRFFVYNVFGPNPSHGREYFDPILSTDHYCVIEGLQSDATYYYQVSSDLPDGTEYIFSTGTFITTYATFAPAQPSCSIITRPNHRTLWWNPITTGPNGNPVNAPITYEVYRSHTDNGQDMKIISSQAFIDNFRKPNYSLPGTADTFQRWQIISGKFVISGCLLWSQSLPDGEPNIAVGDAKFSDFSMVVGTYNYFCGIIFRYQDPSNYWILQGAYHGHANIVVYLIKVVGGVQTFIATIHNWPADFLEVTAIGDQIQILFDGIAQLTITDTFLQSATQYGVYGVYGIGAWDRFTVQEIPAWNTFVDISLRSDVYFYQVVAVAQQPYTGNLYRSLPSEVVTDLGFPTIFDGVGEEFMQNFATFDSSKFDSGSFGI